MLGPGKGSLLLLVGCCWVVEASRGGLSFPKLGKFFQPEAVVYEEETGGNSPGTVALTALVGAGVAAAGTVAASFATRCGP
jgi:hypothetical protein